MVPSVLRRQLGNLDDGFVLRKHSFSNCLEVYPMSEWNKEFAKINKLNPIELTFETMEILNNILKTSQFNLQKVKNCLIINEFFLKINPNLIFKLKKTNILVILITNEIALKNIKTFKYKE